MKTKLSKIIPTVLATVLGLSAFGITPIVYADGDVCNSDAAEEVKNAAGCSGNTNALPGIITVILNSIIAVCGLVAVIYVIIGGVNYMTSSGDSGKLDKAKKTILYACIGLLICALAFAIVNWVIGSLLKQ